MKPETKNLIKNCSAVVVGVSVLVVFTWFILFGLRRTAMFVRICEVKPYQTGGVYHVVVQGVDETYTDTQFTCLFDPHDGDIRSQEGSIVTIDYSPSAIQNLFNVNCWEEGKTNWMVFGLDYVAPTLEAKK